MSYYSFLMIERGLLRVRFLMIRINWIFFECMNRKPAN